MSQIKLLSVVLGRVLLTVTAVLMLSSCAFSPQTIAVKPDANVATMPIGRGRAVSVTTRDMRNDSSIGTRGGLYNSADLTTDARMTQSITEEAVRILQGWDFAAMPRGLTSRNAASFVIEIVDIDYQRPASNVAGNVVVRCRMAVKVSMGTATYEGEYTSRRSEQVAVQPTSHMNVRLVNGAVSQALEQMFRDPKLQRFMADY